jgi:hypothetical protein
MIKSPFSDAVSKDMIPVRGSKGGQYDSQEVPGTPGRDGGLYPELHRDTAVTSQGPSKSGPVKTPFKDAC